MLGFGPIATRAIASTPEIASGLSLAANNLVAGAPVIGSPTLTQRHVLAANNLVAGAPVISSPVLSFNVLGTWQGRIATPQNSANGGQLAPSARGGRLAPSIRTGVIG